MPAVAGLELQALKSSIDPLYHDVKIYMQVAGQAALLLQCQKGSGGLRAAAAGGRRTWWQGCRGSSVVAPAAALWLLLLLLY